MRHYWRCVLQSPDGPVSIILRGRLTVQFPSSYVGDYFFANFCNGWIRKLGAGGKRVQSFAIGAEQPVDLKVSEDGSLYYLELGSGSIYEIRYDG